MSSPYRIASPFLIRLAGVPFDVLEQFATTEASRAARALLNAESQLASLKPVVEQFITRRDNGLSPEAFHAWRDAIRKDEVPPAQEIPEPLHEYATSAAALTKARANLDKELESAVARARRSLFAKSAELLPAYLLFGSGNVHHLMDIPAPGAELPPRNSRARERERHLLLYLQRVAAKNDTFSEFGPSAWGRVVNDGPNLTFSAQPGIQRREAFPERWVALALAAAINADGGAPVRVPAMEPFAFAAIHRELRQGGENSERWLPVADRLQKLASDFAIQTAPAQREKILTQTKEELAQLGAKRETGGRALYAAVNPIVEECSRDCTFELREALLDEVVTQAQPWIDFWRDTYAFVAARVAANLRTLLEKAAPKDRVMPLPAFMQFCEAAKLPLTGPGLVAMPHIAFEEVKAAFRERLRPHADETEYELTADDCAVVRRSFAYPKFDEFTFPSADLQLAAESVEAVNRGEYSWIIGELHPAAAALHHCMFWSCPDKPAFSRALESMLDGKPVCHFGFFAADFTAHTTVRLFDVLPHNSVFVAPQRPNPGWRCVPPEEAEVFIDDAGDVGIRRGREYLGSFARNWVIPLGFHPFLFTIAPHTPRLRCGSVVVQRRAWSVSAEELGGGNFSGVSRDLVLAIERLRAAKDWPRFIYVRPAEAALRRAGAENRDKDTKPVFVDLESYFSLEIFHRWLTKAGELEVTEMLPAPDQLLWQERDGCRTFELRTLICPR